MSDFPRLLLKVNRFDDESWQSYLERMSHHNYPDVSNMVQKIYRDWLRSEKLKDNILLPTHSESFVWLAHLLWLSEEELYKMTRHYFSDVITPSVQEIPTICLTDNYGILLPRSRKHFVTNNKARYCPDCLLNGEYHRQHWSFNLVTICLEHECLLLDHCTHCYETVTVSDICKNICSKCKLSLSRGESADISTDEVGIEAHHFLYNALNRKHQLKIKSKILLLPTRIQYQFLYDLFVLLGNRSNTRVQHQVKDISIKRDNSQYEVWKIYKKVVRAFKILVEWPANFNRFTLGYRAAATKKGLQGGLSRQLGLLYRYVESRWVGDHFRLVQESFEDFFLTHYGRSFHVRKSSYYRSHPTIVNRMELITYVEASKILQLKPKILTFLSEQDYLKRIYSNDSKHSLFYREEVQVLDQQWWNELSLDDVSYDLGLNLNSVELLDKVGFFITDNSNKYDLLINERYPYIFRLRIFQQFRRYNSTKQPLLNLEETIFRLGTIIEVSQFILSGELRGYISSTPNIALKFEDIRFSEIDVQGLLKHV